jgi:multisubunit Na+/H+ antiporter MnhB subunit
MRALYLALALFLLLNLGAGMWRVLRGPTAADRMLAAQLFDSTAVAVLLLLAALARLYATKRNESEAAEGGTAIRRARWLPLVVLLPVAAGLGYAVLSLPPEAAGLRAEVAANLQTSGVSNPVTAVLLNFRGYDTLLELAVLLLALLGIWSLGGASLRPEAAPGPVLDTLSRLLAPVLTLVAAYLLWAFQAGSVLGAVGVLLLLAGWRPAVSPAALPWRLGLVVGPRGLRDIGGAHLADWRAAAGIPPGAGRHPDPGRLTAWRRGRCSGLSAIGQWHYRPSCCWG